MLLHIRILRLRIRFVVMNLLPLDDRVLAIGQHRDKASVAPNAAILRAYPVGLVVVPIVDKVREVAHDEARLLTVRKRPAHCHIHG